MSVESTPDTAVTPSTPPLSARLAAPWRLIAGLQWRAFSLMAAIFALIYWLPVGVGRFDNAVMESLHLVKWYAREHVLLCLVPAFFIAGAIGAFVSQASVMRYLGPRAHKGLAYGVASVSGTLLAVCSCTVLPLFAGIYRMGAGLGPAAAFLYAGPAINVLAIVLTARILGVEMGVGRAVGAILFSLAVGLSMAFIYRKEEKEKATVQMAMPEPEATRPLYQTAIHFFAMVGILVFANWGAPGEAASGFFASVFAVKWWLTAACAVVMSLALLSWFQARLWKVLLSAAAVVIAGLSFPFQPLVPFMVGSVGLAFVVLEKDGELAEWGSLTWGYAKQILPLLLAGVVVAGLLLGRPGHEGLIPGAWVSASLGGNSLGANFFASIAGAFMYFATLTEVPIMQGLMGSGMGKGPALALLLAGPALSLPSMLVLRSIMGWRKTAVFVSLVVVFSTIAGLIFGTV